MKAIVLAAGYATRLYPLTKYYPKPLLKIKNRPIIDYIIDKLAGIDEIFVVTNSKFISHFRKWRPGARSRKSITLVDDLTKDNAARKGAVGDIDFVIDKKKIRDDLLVIGGDNLFSAGLGGFLNYIKKNKKNPVIGAYDIKDKANAAKYGVIKLNNANRVIDFQEKPKNPRTTLVAMCLYYFPEQTLGLIKEYLSDKSRKTDATGFYINWLRKRCPVYGFIFGGRWYDIGDQKFYDKAKEAFAK